MKKFYILFFVCLLTVSISAQEVANSFLERFGKDDNLEVITIGEKMLEAIESISNDDPNFTEAIKGLNNILIISSKDSVLSKEYYDTAYDILVKKKPGFKPLLTLKDNEGNLIIMIKESKGTIKELVLLSTNEKREFSMISLNGKINLNTLTKFSDKMNISGLKALDSINSN